MDAKNLIWIDLEMSGLNPAEDVIIEVATMITDSNLNILAEGPIYAIYQPEVLLESMDEWNTKQHAKSGLTERVRQSKITTKEAETGTIEFLKEWIPTDKSPMAGNSICQDRRFLANYMPDLERYFHYRNLDVSSIKELAKRWRPDIASGVKKTGSHLAMDDIRDSIEELKYYRKTFFQLHN
ncbi:MAG: oligoribonuclease [Cellvibrionaceae bacterium]|jgi:oligoribonuclease